MTSRWLRRVSTQISTPLPKLRRRRHRPRFIDAPARLRKPAARFRRRHRLHRHFLWHCAAVQRRRRRRRRRSALSLSLAGWRSGVVAVSGAGDAQPVPRRRAERRRSRVPRRERHQIHPQRDAERSEQVLRRRALQVLPDPDQRSLDAEPERLLS